MANFYVLAFFFFLPCLVIALSWSVSQIAVVVAFFQMCRPSASSLRACRQMSTLVLPLPAGGVEGRTPCAACRQKNKLTHALRVFCFISWTRLSSLFHSSPDLLYSCSQNNRSLYTFLFLGFDCFIRPIKPCSYAFFVCIVGNLTLHADMDRCNVWHLHANYALQGTYLIFQNALLKSNCSFRHSCRYGSYNAAHSSPDPKEI